jgi:hypothetical protein
VRKKQRPASNAESRTCSLCNLLLCPEGSLEPSDTSCYGSCVVTAGIAPGGSCLQQPTRIKKVHRITSVSEETQTRLSVPPALPSRHPLKHQGPPGSFSRKRLSGNGCNHDTHQGPKRSSKIIPTREFFERTIPPPCPKLCRSLRPIS